VFLRADLKNYIITKLQIKSLRLSISYHKMLLFSMQKLCTFLPILPWNNN